MKALNFRNALAALLAMALSGCAGVYSVKPVDKSLKATVERWAAQSGRTVHWEIEDLEIVDPEALARSGSSTFELKDALSKLLNQAENRRKQLARAAGEPAPLPIQACVYTNAIRVSYVKGAGIPCSG